MMKLNILTLLVGVLAVMAFGFVRAEDSDVDERHVAILGDSNFTTTLGSTKFALVRAWVIAAGERVLESIAITASDHGTSGYSIPSLSSFSSCV